MLCGIRMEVLHMTIFSIIFLILVIIILVSGILMKYSELYKKDEKDNNSKLYEMICFIGLCSMAIAIVMMLILQ